MKLLDSRKFSEIEYLNTYGTSTTVFSTGNAPHNSHGDHCYMMADTTHAKNKQGSKKRKRGTEDL